jgi:hypothetical protein
MKFTGEEYFRASTERMRQARLLHSTKEDYALAMYCSGLSVECILRAFRWKKDKSFEGRHDLEDLFKASDFLRIHEDRARQRGIPEEEISQSTIAFRAAMNEVAVLWHNNLRFASEAGLRAFLYRAGRLQGIRGSALKKNSSDLLNAVQAIVDRGVALWTSKKK